jgi:hypothetical protein
VKNKHSRHRDRLNQQQAKKLDRQLLNLDVFVCKIYWCIGCSKFKIKRQMKFYYRWPKVETLEYGQGRKAKPCLCYECMKPETYRKPWIIKWWNFPFKKPELKFVHGNHKSNNHHTGAMPWMKHYVRRENMYNTGKAKVEALARKEHYGIFRNSDGGESDSVSDSV